MKARMRYCRPTFLIFTWGSEAQGDQIWAQGCSRGLTPPAWFHVPEIWGANIRPLPSLEQTSGKGWSGLFHCAPMSKVVSVRKVLQNLQSAFKDSHYCPSLLNQLHPCLPRLRGGHCSRQRLSFAYWKETNSKWRDLLLFWKRWIFFDPLL